MRKPKVRHATGPELRPKAERKCGRKHKQGMLTAESYKQGMLTAESYKQGMLTAQSYKQGMLTAQSYRYRYC